MRSSTLSLCASQAESDAFTAPSRRTEPDFPPPSLSFLLPAPVWPRVKELLDSDPELTLADLFGPAVEAWLDGLADPDAEAGVEQTRFMLTIAGHELQPPKPRLSRPLTDRQSEVLAFLRERIERFGQSPTIREIGDRFGWPSTNSVICHLDALEKRGIIHRDPFEARGIRLVDERGAA